MRFAGGKDDVTYYMKKFFNNKNEDIKKYDDVFFCMISSDFSRLWRYDLMI